MTRARLGGGEHPGKVLRQELADRECTQADYDLRITRERHDADWPHTCINAPDYRPS